MQHIFFKKEMIKNIFFSQKTHENPLIKKIKAF
jgi:hypothetical protein